MTQTQDSFPAALTRRLAAFTGGASRTEAATPGPWAAIELTAHVTAQGPVLRRFRDGRVAVATGSGRVVGYPVGQPRPVRPRLVASVVTPF